MPKVFLVNVGANTADQGRARSPLFNNGSYIYVSFPDAGSRRLYLPEACPYVSDPANLRTHLDPDWHDLTYGDFCHNARARALLSAHLGDILLFWGLLWRVRGKKSSVWESDEKRWCVLGAMRIEACLESKQTLEHLALEQRRRVANNEHMAGSRVEGRPLVRVFLADKRYSMRFDRAVDLQVYRDDGLLRRTLRSKDGRKIEWGSSPRWNSVMRSCRAVFDLSDPESRGRARIVRESIKRLNPGFDLFAGMA